MGRKADRIGEMATFVRAVDTGSFAAAARAEKLASSAVSRIVARLEQRLGVMLLRRTTRRLQLTTEGERFYRRANAILNDLDAAEREAADAALPVGRVKINSSASYVTHVLSSILSNFLSCYPYIELDLVQSDVVTDLTVDTADIAIRAGPMKNSNLLSRSLGTTRLVVVAAPAWIARQAAGALAYQEALIGFSYSRAAGVWRQAGVQDAARIRVSDGEGMRALALAGVAPARLAEFTVRKDVEAGRLVRIGEAEEDVAEEFHAVFIGPSKMLPSRARAVLDFLSAQGQVS